jgi:hypothetical protein
MTAFARMALLAGSILLLGGAGTFSPSAGQAQDATGPVLLTVTGLVSKPNRGAFDPDQDKFFGHIDIAFPAATGFDFAMLSALDRVKIRADFPKNGPVHEFEGPTLASVLEAAGAKGTTLRLVALDGYVVELPIKDLIRQGAVLAVARDGQPLGIGGFGPTHLVFPRADRADLKDMPDDAWIWSVYQINVE